VIHCPVCSLLLLRQTRSDVLIDFCPNHGIWLDHGELERITEYERLAMGTFVWEDLFRFAATTTSNDTRLLRCPKCRVPLQREDCKGVQVDWCPADGIWLDNDELDAILNNLRLDRAYLHGVRDRFSAARF
jgi:Zn-finger nucleic acid-binding protein